MKLNSLFVAMATAAAVPAMAWVGFGDAGAQAANGKAVRAAATTPAATIRAVDTVLPQLRITGGDWVVVGKSRSLAGVASDDVAIGRVQWYNTRTGQGGPATLSGTGTAATWTIDNIPLYSGDNLVYVAVYDTSGNKARLETTLKTTTPVVSDLSPACKAFYPPTFALNGSVGVDAIPAMARPAKGVAVAEPTYRTCLVRATHHAADGVSGFTRNDYSRRQAFNSDSSHFIVYGLNGAWHLYDANTRSRIKQLAGPAGDAEPQWAESSRDKLYYLPTNGVGMKINELTVSTNATRVIGDLGPRIKARWPTAMAAWTKSEGSPSKNGRYWCLMVDDVDWKSLGVITWDRDTDTILGAMNTNGERPDHVSMSPSGQYCVVSGDGARGTVAYSRDFATSRKLLAKSEHSDIALDANGDDVYVSVDYQSATGDVFMLNLRTGVRTRLFSTYVSGTATALHVSGKAFNKPGWVLLSTYGDYGSSRQWLHRKIFAVQLAASPKIYNLGFTRATLNGYWTEPHATVNREFTRILFNSNWGTSSDTDVDAYTIEIPAGALPAATAPQRMASPLPAVAGGGS